MQARFIQQGAMIDHTPSASVAAGDVVAIGSQLVGIAKSDIAADTLGALATEGVFDIVKDGSEISAGDPLYWDDNGSPVGGVALSGAISDSSADGPFIGWAVDDAGASATTVRVLLKSIDEAHSVVRSDLVQDDLAVYGLDLQSWRTTATMQPLGTTAGTPAGAFGITAGTHGTAAPVIASQAASGASVTNSCRRQFTLPPEYVAGQTVTLRVRAIETVGAAQVSTTIDAEVFEANKDGGLGGSPTDLCATNALDVTTDAGNKDFTITPTGLAPGDVLDIELTGVVNDTGGTTGTVLQLTDIALLLDIKG